jgi:hypothetical protein
LRACAGEEGGEEVRETERGREREGGVGWVGGEERGCQKKKKKRAERKREEGDI